MRRVGLLVAVAACGRANFEPVTRDGGDRSDAPADGALAAPSCLRMETPGPLTTDFNTGLPAFAQVSAPPPTLDIADGQLRGIPIMEAGNHYAELTSIAIDGYTDRRVFLQVPRMVNTAGCAQASMMIVTSDASEYVELSQACNEMIANSWSSGVETTIADIPYDPAAHRWWQIRSQIAPSPTVSFEVSPDGIVWTSIGSIAQPAFFTAAQLQLAVGTYQLETLPPGEVRFDDLTDCIGN